MDTVLTNVIQLWWYVKDNPALVAGLGGYGITFAFVIQYLKVKFKLDERVINLTKHLDLTGKGILNALLLFMTVVATVIDLSTQLFDAFPNAGVTFPIIYLVIAQAHRLVVSPLWTSTRNRLEEKRQQGADAEAYRKLVSAQKERAVPTQTTGEALSTSTDVYDPTQIVQG